MFTRLKTAWRLGRWLGPWTAAEVTASGVSREEMTIPSTGEGDVPMRAWVLSPSDRPATGSLFVVPGLHYLGPEDPRMLRFLAAVAASGVEVFAPFLPTPLALRLEEEAYQEAARALEFALSRPGARRPGLFTISFGSILGARLAADPRFGDRIGDLMLFGGFCDWREVLRYSVTDRDTSGDVVPPDPLNQVVIYLNLVDGMPNAPAATGPLCDAWLAFALETWGDPEMKARDRYVPVARRLAETLREVERPLFLRGCSVEPGALAEVDQALEAKGDRLAWLDPRPHLAAVAGVVHIVHGADDDVVPVGHADQLLEACSSSAAARRWVTGMYGHTGPQGLAGLLGRGPAALRELRTMVGLLWAIASLAHPRGA